MATLSSLQDIAIFVEVARVKSFSRAARILGLSAATLSRRIAAMEGRHGTRLFHRSTRRVELTDAAQRLWLRCERLTQEAQLVEQALADEAGLVRGMLRVSMPVDLGVHWIGPLLPEFARRHPGVSVSLDLSPQYRDLAADPVDVAIRIGQDKAADVVSRRIGWITRALYASPAYLARRGHPATVTDLAAHEGIFDRTGRLEVEWPLERGDERVTVAMQGRATANNLGLVRTLAERDMGVALLPTMLVGDALRTGRLLPILADWAPPRLGLYAAMPSRRLNARARAFVEFLAERLELS